LLEPATSAVDRYCYLQSYAEIVGGWHDPTFDRLVDRVATDPNTAERMRLYRQAEHRLLTQAAAVRAYGSGKNLVRAGSPRPAAVLMRLRPVPWLVVAIPPVKLRRGDPLMAVGLGRDEEGFRHTGGATDLMGDVLAGRRPPRYPVVAPPGQQGGNYRESNQSPGPHQLTGSSIGATECPCQPARTCQACSGEHCGTRWVEDLVQ
jgi:hypothetical protein